MYSPETTYYFERFGFIEPQILQPPHPDLALVVVIPCFNEPHLLLALDSVWNSARPSCAVEIIVVINSPEGGPSAVLAQNQQSHAKALLWARNHSDDRLRLHPLHFPSLPPKISGVGLARKIGMDEALRRLDLLHRPEALIVCFDADCTCDPNYLTEIENWFQSHPKAPGASIYFEHPLQTLEPPGLSEAIAAYELHLRYYVEALRYSGFPHAYHTVGSSMAVRARHYREQGGMNKRQAGEDFYFLHKIIPLGHFGEINTTRVIPSPRPSDRVPFGTGKGVSTYLQLGRQLTYSLSSFNDLRTFFASLPSIYEHRKPDLPAGLSTFLDTVEFERALERIRSHTNSYATFRKQFFRWFDGFKAMKWLHFARDNFYPSPIVTTPASELLALLGHPPPSESTPDLLATYRTRQQKAWSPSPE